MRSRWFVLVVIFAATLGTLHSGPDDATVNVVASSSAGDRLAPEIHLYQLGSQRDFWPDGAKQVARGVPYGYYSIEVSMRGFRTYHRELELGQDHVDVRVVLAPSDEAHGPMELGGTVIHSKDNSELWAVAFPLAGSPSDATECQIDGSGRFKITTVHSGPYVLAVVRGQKLLGSQAVFIGYRNAELTIDLHE